MKFVPAKSGFDEAFEASGAVRRHYQSLISTLQAGRHYDDVPPNKGSYRGGAKETLEAEVRTELSVRTPISTLHEEAAAQQQ